MNKMPARSLPKRAGSTTSDQQDRQFARPDPVEGYPFARLKLKEGDKLISVEQTEGGLRLSPFNPKHAKTMEIARRSCTNYRGTFASPCKMNEPIWLDVG